MNVVEAAVTVVYTMLCKAMALYHQYHLDKQPACKTIVLKLCVSDFWGCTYPANVYSIDSLHFSPFLQVMSQFWDTVCPYTSFCSLSYFINIVVVYITYSISASYIRNHGYEDQQSVQYYKCISCPCCRCCHYTCRKQLYCVKCKGCIQTRLLKYAC